MQFYHVLRKRNTPGVKHLVLNEGVSVNHMFADGSYPVHIAAERADVENLRFLLSMRACPDMKNRHGQTALMLGIDFVDVVLALVIEYRCRVDLRLVGLELISFFLKLCFQHVSEMPFFLLFADFRIFGQFSVNLKLFSLF